MLWFLRRLPARAHLPLTARALVQGASLRLLAKRVVDLTGALVGLILLTPVILAIAVLIRLEARGPTLFRQLRRGYRGQLFRVLKFRTMSVDAEQRLGDLEDSNESAGGCSSSYVMTHVSPGWDASCDATASMNYPS